jgi:hypothetical protein
MGTTEQATTPGAGEHNGEQRYLYSYEDPAQ